MGVRMSIYFVVNNETGTIVNAITYDGESPYEEIGHTVVASGDAPEGAWIGWTLTDDGWKTPEEIN